SLTRRKGDPAGNVKLQHPIGAADQHRRDQYSPNGRRRGTRLPPPQVSYDNDQPRQPQKADERIRQHEPATDNIAGPETQQHQTDSTRASQTVNDVQRSPHQEHCIVPGVPGTEVQETSVSIPAVPSINDRVTP